MADPIATVIADPNRLFRSGIARLLEGRNYDVQHTVNRLADLDPPPSDPAHPTLVLFDLAWTTAELSAVLQWHRHPAIRLVLLTEQCAPAVLQRVVKLGLAGYILKTVDDAALFSMLQLVMLGERVYPAALTELLLTGVTADDAVPVPASRFAALSPREATVLELLVGGRSNKQIGLELGITEECTKQHVRNLYRKLKVASRSQAVALALKNGFSRHDHAPLHR